MVVLAVGAADQVVAVPPGAGDMTIKRTLKHLFALDGLIQRRSLPRADLDAIEAAVKASEAQHNGELRVVIEASLNPAWVWKHLTPRARAQQLFSTLGVWDTAQNSGVLIYLQLVDRAIEIVADRGIAARVEQARWDAICRRMEDAFRDQRFRAGILTGIEEITALLARHFPPGEQNPDELPDRPIVL